MVICWEASACGTRAKREAVAKLLHESGDVFRMHAGRRDGGECAQRGPARRAERLAFHGRDD